VNGYLLDTNVVSELRKRERCNAGLATWYAQRNRRELFLSSISLAELRRGIALAERRDPIRADHLRRWADRVQRKYGRIGHLISIRAAEAAAWGALQAIRPLPVLDGFLAATAKTHDLILVTRNEADFVGLPIMILNPFT
jgi:predicted nucleic acid-binding protein